MTDYTPTTDEVRKAYVHANADTELQIDKWETVFDRWLAAHDAEVRADEREQAAKRVHHRMEAMQADPDDIPFVEAAARGEDN